MFRTKNYGKKESKNMQKTILKEESQWQRWMEARDVYEIPVARCPIRRRKTQPNPRSQLEAQPGTQSKPKSHSLALTWILEPIELQ